MLWYPLTNRELPYFHYYYYYYLLLLLLLSLYYTNKYCTVLRCDFFTVFPWQSNSLLKKKKAVRERLQYRVTIYVCPWGSQESCFSHFYINRMCVLYFYYHSVTMAYLIDIQQCWCISERHLFNISPHLFGLVSRGQIHWRFWIRHNVITKLFTSSHSW